MSGDRLLIDTVFVQALLGRRDQHRDKALALLSRMREAAEVLVSEAVLVEVGDALRAFDREGAADWIETCYRTRNIKVIAVDSALLLRALQLYRTHSDKPWSLTDCISFVVMREHGLTDALTADRHFVQAGLRALMLEEA